MALVQRSALVPYPPARIFDIVNDVGRYPEFIRGCAAAEVIDAGDAELTAALVLTGGGVSETITTRNRLHRPHRIDLELVQGPFQRFGGTWLFTDLGAGGHPGTKVELSLEFAFASPMLRVAFAGLFTGVANRMVDAFCSRAHDLLGR